MQVQVNCIALWNSVTTALFWQMHWAAEVVHTLQWYAVLNIVSQCLDKH